MHRICIGDRLRSIKHRYRKLSDIVQPEKHAGIRDVKDIAAGAVIFV